MTVRDKVAGTAILGLLAVGGWHVINSSAAGGDGEGFEPHPARDTRLQPVRSITLVGDLVPADTMIANWVAPGDSGEAEPYGVFRRVVAVKRGATVSLTIVPFYTTSYQGIASCNILKEDGTTILTGKAPRTATIRRGVSGGAITCSGLVP